MTLDFLILLGAGLFQLVALGYLMIDRNLFSKGAPSDFSIRLDLSQETWNYLNSESDKTKLLMQSYVSDAAFVYGKVKQHKQAQAILVVDANGQTLEKIFI